MENYSGTVVGPSSLGLEPGSHRLESSRALQISVVSILHSRLESCSQIYY
jgi:hypothetical protein